MKCDWRIQRWESNIVRESGDHVVLAITVPPRGVRIVCALIEWGKQCVGPSSIPGESSGGEDGRPRFVWQHKGLIVGRRLRSGYCPSKCHCRIDHRTANCESEEEFHRPTQQLTYFLHCLRFISTVFCWRVEWEVLNSSSNTWFSSTTVVRLSRNTHSKDKFRQLNFPHLLYL